MTAVGNTLFFVADDGVTGYELWKSDGTEAGTTLVKDITPGRDVAGQRNQRLPRPVGLTAMNGTLFFQDDDGVHGKELWKSDGTEAGTVMVKDINPGADPFLSKDSYPNLLTVVGGTLFFTASDGVHPSALWRSDGTEDGTNLVKSITPPSTPLGNGLSSLTDVNGTLFFVAEDDSHGRELWTSDGTEAGTVLVKDLRPGTPSSFPSGLQAFGQTLFFWASDDSVNLKLWQSDGTTPGTVPAGDFLPGSNGAGVGLLGELDGKLIFTATSVTHGLDLWTGDGTAARTSLVGSIEIANASSSIQSMTDANGRLFFTAADGIHRQQLWTSDGTAAGTRMVKPLEDGSTFAAWTTITSAGGKVFFVVNRQGLLDLWTSDGTAAGTFVVKGVGKNYREGFGGRWTSVGGTLFFTWVNTSGSDELWKTDGTAAGTVLLSKGDEYPSYLRYSISFLARAGSTVFFSWSEGPYSTELWKTDGTVTGTARVQTIVPYPTGRAELSSPVALNGTLFFLAPVVGGSLQVWKSDGTEAGTVRVAADEPTYYIVFSDTPPISVNGTLYFTRDDGVHGEELWESDGTAAGTKMVKDILVGENSSYPGPLTAMAGVVYFSANDGGQGRSLWRTDGTEDGTRRVKAFPDQLYGASPQNLASFNGKLFFTLGDQSHGEELWRSDGTEAGTYTLDLAPGSRASNPSRLLPVGSKLFFTALDNAGVELWVYPNNAPEVSATTTLLPAVSPRNGNPPGSTVAGLLRSAADFDGNALGVAVTAATGVGTWQYRLGGGPWRNFGAMTQAAARLLRPTDQIRFVPSSKFLGAATITYHVWDQTSGMAGGVADLRSSARVGGSSAFSVGVQTARLVVNNAPLLNPTPRAFAAILEDHAQPPQRVGNLLVNRVADPDPGALKGVAVRGASGNGTWQYSLTNGATWAALGTVSDGGARLLRDNDLVRFLPSANWHGVASLSFRAWDRTIGGAGGLLNLQDTGTGGGWAVSAAISTAALTVRSINDAPVLPPSSVTLPSLPRTTTNSAGIAVSLLLDGVGDADAGALRGAALVGSTGGGTWQYSTNGGTTWLNLGAVTAANARLLRDTDLIRFVPSGTFVGNATLTLRAWDRTTGLPGGVANLTAATSVGGRAGFSLGKRTALLPVTE